jgi:hypothetical protein
MYTVCVYDIKIPIGMLSGTPRSTVGGIYSLVRCQNLPQAITPVGGTSIDWKRELSRREISHRGVSSRDSPRHTLHDPKAFEGAFCATRSRLATKLQTACHKLRKETHCKLPRQQYLKSFTPERPYPTQSKKGAIFVERVKRCIPKLSHKMRSDFDNVISRQQRTRVLHDLKDRGFGVIG